MTTAYASMKPRSKRALGGADRGAGGGLVQVDGLTTELPGVFLPGDGSGYSRFPSAEC